MKSHFYVSHLTVALSMVTLIAGCGQEKDDDPGPVTLSLAMESGGAALAGSAVKDVKLCFKRLRFKTAEEDTASAEKPPTADEDDADSDNIDFDIGEVTLATGEKKLGDIELAAGSYRRIDLDLDKKCNGYSVMMTNANGTFQTDDRVKIKFRGDFQASESNKSISLVVDTLIAGLENVKDGSEIKAAIGNPSGVAKNK